MKRILLLLPTLLIALITQGQGPLNDGSNISPVYAPENLRQSEGKTPGSQYSVDMFSGTANVNIPIYSSIVDGLDLGVSLSYNTGGVRVDDIASDEGLNWNLNTGGYITRQVNGLEDELTLQPMGLHWYGGFQWPNIFKQIGSWVDNTNGNATTDVEGDEQAELGQADVFTAAFAGRTVRFLIYLTNTDYGYNAKYSIVTDPKSHIYVDIRVDDTSLYGLQNQVGATVPVNRCGPNRSSGIVSFRITDEHGNQFFFDRGDYQIKKEYLSDTAYQIYFATNKWVLTKVITYTGRQVTFNYQTYNSVNYPMYCIDKVSEQTGDMGMMAPGDYVHVDSAEVPVYDSGTISHISSIQYPDGTKVNFSLDPMTRCDVRFMYALDSISINKAYDSKVSNTFTYKFNYSYFVANSTSDEAVTGCLVDQTDLRLKLNSIYKFGTDHISSQLYDSFVYNTGTPLPPRLSPSKDYYGYANGQKPAAFICLVGSSNYSYLDSSQFNHLSIPYHTFAFYNSHDGNAYVYTYGVNRSPNINYATADILTDVVNGHGGRTHFTYGANNLALPPDCRPSPLGAYTQYYSDDTFTVKGTYSISPGLDGTGAPDGVCVTQISDYDGYNSDHNTTTYYNYANGMSFYPGGYYWYPLYCRSERSIDTTYDNTWFARFYTNSFVTPMEDINGFIHGYSDVTAVTKGYNNEIISNKHYHFSNLISQANEIAGDKANISRLSNHWGLYTHTFPINFFLRDRLGLLIEEDDSDKYGHLMSQTVNQYQAYPGNPVYEAIFYYYYTTYDPTYALFHTTFTSDSYRPVVDEIVKLYKTTTKSFFGSSGQYMIDSATYSYDGEQDLMSVAGTDSRGQSYSVNYGYDSTLTTYDKVDILWKFMTERNKTLNGNFVQQLRLADSLPGATYGTPPNQAFFPFVYSMKANASSSTYPRWPSQEMEAKHFTMYDDHSNALETRYMNEKKVACFFWDNRIGRKVAAVSNASYSQVACTSFEGAGYQPLHTADYNKGNWDFNPAEIKFADTTGTPAMTGRYYLTLPFGQYMYSFNPPAANVPYIISMWTNADSSLGNVYSPLVFLGSTQVHFTVQAIVGSWWLVTGTFTGNGTDKISITGDVNRGFSNIDELRMYPASASVTTTTYEPLLGASSVCDERNNILYYEYDPMGNLKVTRDINRNVISLTQTITQGSNK